MSHNQILCFHWVDVVDVRTQDGSIHNCSQRKGLCCSLKHIFLSFSNNRIKLLVTSFVFVEVSNMNIVLLGLE